MALEQPVLIRAVFLKTRTKYILITSVFAIAWIAAIAYGLNGVLNYDHKPGAVGSAPTQWPESTAIARSKQNTLVMLAHPRCPCTRASVDELARVMARVQRNASAYVLLLKPEGTDADWDDTELRRKAAAIPGVTVVTDVDGIEAHRFGAETSGHTLLFDATGRLVFSGGITESRGHAGDNVGENAIVSFINQQKKGTNQSFVFGCPLHDGNAIAKKSCPR